MVSDQVAAQMAAIEEHSDHLEENQYKMADAIQQMVCGDTTISGEGGIPLVIDTKLMGTAPTEGNTNFFLLMAQQNQQHQVLQAMQAAVKKLVAGGGGGNCCRNTNNNTNDPTLSTKGVVTVYRQWNKCCHSCGVVLCDKRGYGTGGGKDYLFKKESHRDEATFTNKMGGNTRHDYLWNL